MAEAATRETVLPAIDPGPIERITVTTVRLPVRRPRRHGVGDVAQAVDNVLLRLESAGGVVGWGEASPWPVFTGTAAAAAAALDVHLRPLLQGADPRRITAIMDRADHALVGHPEAKAALETALLDLLGRAAGLPVAELLGGRCRETIPLSVSLADPDLAADLDLAQRAHADGVRLFKVKTGFAAHAFDLQRLETLRETFDDIDLRVDYNQGLEPFGALRRLRDIEAFKPTFIEQPVAARHWDAMAALTAALDTPVLADESVFTPNDALRAVQARIADGVSIKIMKSGGLTRAREVAAIAAAAGLAGYGGDMFETGIAHLAGAHMVAATLAISLGCEFYQATYYLERDLLAAPFPVRDGAVVVPETPGLGIAVDEAAVRAHAIDSRG